MPKPVRSFHCEGLEIPIGNYPFEEQTSGPAWLGIRPEHIRIGEAAETCAFKADLKIDLVEPMGADTLVWTNLAGKPFRMRLEGQAEVTGGDTVHVGIDPSVASLFDVATEQRL